MRLQLIAMLAALAAAAPASAQEVDEREPGDGTVETSVALYADDDETTVVTSLVDGQVRLPAPVVVDAHALVDAVSSASVDVISAATTVWTENRVELGASAVARLAETDLSAGYVTSGENDWRSHTALLGVSRQIFEKNTTLSAGYAYTDNRIGRAYDPMFERSLVVHGGEVGVSQLLDDRTLVGATYTVQHSVGYHASPYRFVTTASGLASPELHPGDRTRHGVTLRVLRAIGDAASLDAQYRLYSDGWGVRSHTGTIAWTRELGDTIDLRIRARGYYQGAADFYRETYDMPMRYMSADRELSTFWDTTLGLKLSWTGERWAFDAKIDGSYYRFLDFARLEGRVALVTAGGVRWSW
jgi:hypothetical protein